MKFNKARAIIGLVSAALLTLLVLCPPWQEAAQNEVTYRKDIGRGLLWSPPNTVPVDCYFVGCKVAPASYFHAVLNRQLLVEQTIPVLFVAGVFLWMFRTQEETNQPLLGSRKNKLIVASLLALLIPPVGGVPMGAALASLPLLFIDKGEFWAVYAVVIPAMYIVLALVIFVLLIALQWLVARTKSVRVE
jgi:hypothetical protein